MNKLHIHERLCTPCSKRVRKCVCWCHNLNTCLTYTPVHAWCSKHLSECMLHSPQKMHMHPWMCTYAPVQKFLCHGNCWKLILSFVRALCRLLFANCAAVSTNSFARLCSLKKSVQIHASSWRSRCCDVSQASFDHLCWCRPHPIFLWFALETWPRGSPHPKFYFRQFSREIETIRATPHLLLPWLAHDEAPGPYITIPRYRFNKTKQHYAAPGFFEAGFRPRDPLMFWFVPLSRTKLSMWISTKIPPGPSIQVLPGCRVWHPLCSKKVLEQIVQIGLFAFLGCNKLAHHNHALSLR